MSMDLLVAEAALVFDDDLRNAQEAAGEWTDEVLAQGYRPRSDAREPPRRAYKPAIGITNALSATILST